MQKYIQVLVVVFFCNCLNVLASDASCTELFSPISIHRTKEPEKSSVDLYYACIAKLVQCDKDLQGQVTDIFVRKNLKHYKGLPKKKRKGAELISACLDVDAKHKSAISLVVALALDPVIDYPIIKALQKEQNKMEANSKDVPDLLAYRKRMLANIEVWAGQVLTYQESRK